MALKITGTAVVVANASKNTTIGTISVVPPHPDRSTFELVTNPNTYFALTDKGVLTTAWSGTAVAGTYPIKVHAHGPGWNESADLTIQVAAVSAPPTLSPDGSSISGGTGSLVTADGTWTFGAATPQWPGFWKILLNGTQARGGNAKTLEVLNGGKLYHFGTDNRWYRWDGFWVVTSDPHVAPPAPTPTKIVLNPPTISIPDNSPIGTGLSAAAVTMSDGSGFSGVLAASDTLVGISGMALKSTRGLTPSDDGVRNVVVTATQNGSSVTATLGLTITAVVTPPGLAPDGSSISGGTGSLVTVDGTWSFGAAASGRPGEWSILLSGKPAPVGIAGSLEVNKGGKLYALTVLGNNWYLWQNGAFVPSSDPSPPSPTLNMILNPSSVTLFDNAPAGSTLCTVTVTMSDGSNFVGHLTVSDDIVSINGMALTTSRGLIPADARLHNVLVTAIP